jgi:LysM repeat protein
MKKRSSAPARIFATLAVIGGFVLVVVVLSSALSEDSGDDGGTKARGDQAAKQQQPPPKKKTPATYEVEDGDTLTSIAHSTGVSVGMIERLTPGTDPQILGPGEVLKLK